MTAAARILLADDDPEVRGILSDSLTFAGHQVTEVADGDSALALLAKTGFDVLLTDVRMPGETDGFKLARAARKLCPGIKTVCATGYHELKIERGDCDALLYKPFSLRILIDTVAELIRTR